MAVKTPGLLCAIPIPPHVHLQGAGTPPFGTRETVVATRASTIIPGPTGESEAENTTKALQKQQSEQYQNSVQQSQAHKDELTNVSQDFFTQKYREIK